MNTYHVYSITGEVNIDNKFVEKTWLGFFTIIPPYGTTSTYILLGKVNTNFPIKYPLFLDNNHMILEGDYYRGEFINN